MLATWSPSMSVQANDCPTLDISELPRCLMEPSSEIAVLRHSVKESRKARQAARRVRDEERAHYRVPDCHLCAGPCRRQAFRTGRGLDPIAGRNRKGATDTRGRKEARRLRFSEGRSGLPMQTGQHHPDHAYAVAADRGPTTSGLCGDQL